MERYKCEQHVKSSEIFPEDYNFLRKRVLTSRSVMCEKEHLPEYTVGLFEATTTLIDLLQTYASHDSMKIQDFSVVVDDGVGPGTGYTHLHFSGAPSEKFKKYIIENITSVMGKVFVSGMNDTILSKLRAKVGHDEIGLEEFDIKELIISGDFYYEAIDYPEEGVLYDIKHREITPNMYPNTPKWHQYRVEMSVKAIVKAPESDTFIVIDVATYKKINNLSKNRIMSYHENFDMPTNEQFTVFEELSKQMIEFYADYYGKKLSEGL